MITFNANSPISKCNESKSFAKTSSDNTSHSVHEHSEIKKIPSELYPAYFTKMKKQHTSFRGAPWKLNLLEMGIPTNGPINSEQAINIFEKFKLGNYLDIGEDINDPNLVNIRKENLKFLDRIDCHKDKEDFVNYFKKLTGLPNLKVISEKIENEFINAVSKSEENLLQESDSFKVIRAGYDSVCSVGRRNALPGSDLDKAYIIIKGGDNPEYELNKFKGQLWENTDQRILSYNHDFASFPQVYTLGQVKKLFFAINSVTEKFGLHNEILPSAKESSTLAKTTMYDKYLSLMQKYNEDYVAANPFYIRVCNEFPNNCNDFDLNNPNKNSVKNFGFFTEALREGLVCEKFTKDNLDEIKNYDVYNLTNLSQLHALKLTNSEKPKRIEREILQRDFESWPIDKQFRCVCSMIEGSCGNNTEFSEEFAQFYKVGKDPFEPLINALSGKEAK